METSRGQTTQSSARDRIRAVQTTWKPVLFLGRKLLMAFMVTQLPNPLRGRALPSYLTHCPLTAMAWKYQAIGETYAWAGRLLSWEPCPSSLQGYEMGQSWGCRRVSVKLLHLPCSVWAKPELTSLLKWSTRPSVGGTQMTPKVPGSS